MIVKSRSDVSTLSTTFYDLAVSPNFFSKTERRQSKHMTVPGTDRLKPLIFFISSRRCYSLKLRLFSRFLILKKYVGPDLFLAFSGFTEMENGKWEFAALFPGGPSQIFGIVSQKSTSAQCLPDNFSMSQYWKFQFEGVYVTARDGAIKCHDVADVNHCPECHIPEAKCLGNQFSDNVRIWNGAAAEPHCWPWMAQLIWFEVFSTPI